MSDIRPPAAKCWICGGHAWVIFGEVVCDDCLEVYPAPTPTEGFILIPCRAEELANEAAGIAAWWLKKRRDRQPGLFEGA